MDNPKNDIRKENQLTKVMPESPEVITIPESDKDRPVKESVIGIVKSTFQSYWNDMTKFERSTVALTFLGLVAGFITVAIFYKQLVIMSEQLNVMSKQLDQTIETSLLDQRAWVGATSLDRINFTVDSKGIVWLVIRNSGKTPALNFTSQMSIRSSPKGQKFTPNYPPEHKDAPVSVIQPGMEVLLPLSTNQTFSNEMIELVKSGSHILYVFGKFNYEDIFKRIHGGTFCFYISPDLNTARVCRDYNQSDY